jgi:hypothetical protein
MRNRGTGEELNTKMNDLISLKLGLEDGDVEAAEDLHEDLLAQQRVYLACRTQLISFQT